MLKRRSSHAAMPRGHAAKWTARRQRLAFRCPEAASVQPRPRDGPYALRRRPGQPAQPRDGRKLAQGHAGRTCRWRLKLLQGYGIEDALNFSLDDFAVFLLGVAAHQGNDGGDQIMVQAAQGWLSVFIFNNQYDAALRGALRNYRNALMGESRDGTSRTHRADREAGTDTGASCQPRAA